MAFTMCRDHWNMLIDELEDRGLGKYLVNSNRELESVEFRDPGFQGLGMITNSFVHYLRDELKWSPEEINRFNQEAGEHDPVYKINKLCMICWMVETQKCNCEAEDHSFERWIEFAAEDVQELFARMTTAVPRLN